MLFKLSVIFLKEGSSFVAYSPDLDLSTCGKTAAQAKLRFEEAATLFLESLNDRGVTEEVLVGLGWRKRKETWHPPVIIFGKGQLINIPVYS